MALFSTERVAWLRHHQRLTHGVIAMLWAAIFIFFYLGQGPVHNALWELDLQFADALEVKGRLTPPNPDIVFLGIDSASMKLDALDPALIQKDPILSLMAKDWPWSREVHAAILDRLIQAGARAVIFDILFISPKEQDAAFKTALDHYAGQVIVGCNVGSNGKAIDFPSATLMPQLDPRSACVNFWPDQDNVIRKSLFQVRYFGPSIGEAESKVMIDSVASRTLRILDKGDLIPTDGLMHWFRPTGGRGSFQTFSVYQLFYPPDWENLFQRGAFFKNKIVMVGPRENFQQDMHSTPLALKGMDGAEIHLQALNAVLHGELLAFAGDRSSWVVGLVTLAAFIAWMLGITMQRVTLKRVLITGIIAVSVATAYFFSSQQLYSHGIILIAAAPFGTLVMTMVTGLGGQYILEQFERTRTRRFFERYVSPKIVKEIMDNPGSYDESRNGRRREVTILFSDLRGFTSMTENADSEQLVRELNEYLHKMTDALFENDGTLDKFIGDAVMAFWGGFKPKPEEDTHKAVLAALAMHRELDVLNVHRRERGLKDLAMGVGINHGEAIVGDIGSEQQRNFTVIGDSVNLASRLEGTTKEYGVGILISEAVEAFVRPYFHLQTVDSIVVKGRTKPVMTYTVLGLKEETLPARQVDYLEKFEAAMRLYRSESFREARKGFMSCLELYPDDKLAKTFKERSEEFALSPPPQPWDGSYTMTRK